MAVFPIDGVGGGTPDIWDLACFLIMGGVILFLWTVNRWWMTCPNCGALKNEHMSNTGGRRKRCIGCMNEGTIYDGKARL